MMNNDENMYKIRLTPKNRNPTNMKTPKKNFVKNCKINTVSLNLQTLKNSDSNSNKTQNVFRLQNKILFEFV